LKVGALGIYFKYEATDAFGGTCPITPDTPAAGTTVYVNAGAAGNDLAGLVGGEGDILFTNLVYEGYADIQLDSSGRDIKGDEGLENAVLISLFTNRRVNDETVLPGNANDKGGWWGNEFNEFEIGSRLWLLRRAKNTDDTLSLAEQYARESMNWMLENNVAQRVDVATSFVDRKTMLMEVQVIRPDVTQQGEYTYRYFFNWENQIARRG
jgi:phage gp46-like protein